MAASAAIGFVGLIFIQQAIVLHVGTPLDMGPGFFPLVLGCLCFLFAAVDGLRIYRNATDSGAEASADWRAIGAVVAAMVSFMISMQYLGLGPASFILVVISSFATKVGRWRNVIVLGVFAAALSWAIFNAALSLPIPFFKVGF
jgi:hypothetical protein